MFVADELSKKELGAHIPRVWETFFQRFGWLKDATLLGQWGSPGEGLGDVGKDCQCIQEVSFLIFSYSIQLGTFSWGDVCSQNFL